MFIFTWIGELIVTLIAANAALGVIEFCAYLLDNCIYSSLDDDVLLGQHIAISLIALIGFLVATCIVIAGTAPEVTAEVGTWV